MSKTRLLRMLRKLAIFAKHGWRMRAKLSMLRRSGLFDSHYYLRCYPEVAEYEGGPLLHYAVHGSSEGRNPSPLFNEQEYRANYPGVQQQGGIGLLHYLHHDDHNPNPWFDSKWYKLQYPDVNATGLTPLAHYLAFGANEGKDPSTRFSTAYYRQTNPEVATSGVNPLAHFLEFGIRQGRLPVPHGHCTMAGRPVLESEIHCLKRAAGDRDAALFVAHSPDGKLKPHVEHYLRALRLAGISVTLLVAADQQFLVTDELLATVSGLYVRRNEGLDFAAWAHLLRLEPSYYDADTLYLLNDSLIGPFNQADFERVIARIRESRAEVIGMTESSERTGWHLQSYFLALKSPVLHSEALQNFFREIEVLDDKDEVINRYELRLSPVLKQAGFDCEALFVSPGPSNPTIFRWRHLIELGFPFVKVMTLRDSIAGVDTSDWREVVGRKGYEVALAEQTVLEARMNSKSAPDETIYYSNEEYQAWVRNHDTMNDSKRALIRNSIARLGRFPLFSIVLLPAVANTNFRDTPLADSLLRQLYVQWELLLPASSETSRSASDDRIRHVGGDPHVGEGPAAAFNAALAMAQGDYVVPLPANAKLAEHALYELAVAIANDPEAALLYSDEDRIDASGKRHSPWFKTGWDPCLALAKDSIGLLAAYQVDSLRQLGGMRSHNDDLALAQYELSLRTAFAAPAEHVHHIPLVLCHRAVVDAPSQAHGDGMRVIVRSLIEESGIAATVIPAPAAHCWSWIRRELPKPEPLVSIIVPTRDRADLLERCTASLISNTDYPAIELLIVDNGTQEPSAIALLKRLSLHRSVRVLPYPGEFNYAAINNFAAREARGEILVLLNNDTESIRPDWLRAMVAHAIQPSIGAVGARLLYSDGRVQHAGMVNQPDGPVHQFRFAHRHDVGPMGELCLTRSVTMVTGACLALRRTVYFEAGGLDEDLRVAFNDVDLCMKLGDLGYRIVWTPDAELFHFESASRGYDVTPEKQALAAREFERFKRRWGSLLSNDPFRNPNLNYGWDKITLATPPQRPPSWLGHSAPEF